MNVDGNITDCAFDGDGCGLDAPHGSPRPERDTMSEKKDYFSIEDGVRYAGKHLLIDLKGGQSFDDLGFIEETLRKCVAVTGATLLHIHLHHFTPYGGVSGVAVLAESHISIHTWPEESFAALDVFMCGDTEPNKAIDVLREAFQPTEINVQTVKRGQGFNHERS